MAEVINIEDFKTRRQNFLVNNQVSPETLNQNPRRRKQEQERYVSVSKQKAIKMAKQKSKRRKLKAKLAMGAGVVTLVLGSIGAHKAIKAYNEPNENMNTIQEALNDGATLENLGINEEIAKDIQNLKLTMLNTEKLQNMSIKETKELEIKTQEVMEDVVEYKLADLFDTSPELIQQGIGEENAYLIITGKDGDKATYEPGIYGMLSKSIPKDLAKFIEQINECQCSNTENKDAEWVNKPKIFKDCKKYIDYADLVAGTELEITEKGDIEITERD